MSVQTCLSASLLLRTRSGDERKKYVNFREATVYPSLASVLTTDSLPREQNAV